MKFATIVSGSTGNCIYIEGSRTRILVDAGLSIKALTAACHGFGCTPDQLQAILITHEHRDHICGAERISRRFGIPLWASRDTWEKLPFAACFSGQQRHIFNYGMSINELGLDFFSLSHDCVQPLGLVVSEGDCRLAIATDTGCVTPAMAKALRDCDGYVLEANHDLDMLRTGPYPYSLKQRVLSSRGHLSNAQAALALAELAGPHSRHVILAHLSQTNNRPDLALRQVSSLLSHNQYQPRLSVAPADSPHELIEL